MITFRRSQFVPGEPGHPAPENWTEPFMQLDAGGAGGARTHDRRIMRSLARRSGCAACTDTTEPCHR
jgi:hypothetical protein